MGVEPQQLDLRSSIEDNKKVVDDDEIFIWTVRRLMPTNKKFENLHE